MSSGHVVTVGIPVYRGGEVLGETLTAIQTQTYRDVKVVISVDGDDPDSAAICRPFLRDPRFSLSTRRRRRGWVGNLDWLLRQAHTAYWCTQPQDDVVDPDYLAVLVDHLRSAPRAVVAYSDIETFGARSGRLIQRSVAGSPHARQLDLLCSHYSAVAFRGVTRTGAIRRMGRLAGNPVEDFGVDTVWMAAMAATGELQRVPGARYRKRYHGDNVHTRWSRWSAAKRNRAWAVHCADMLDQALRVAGSIQQRRLLWAAGVARLSATGLNPAVLSAEVAEGRGHEDLLRTFLARMNQQRPDVGTVVGMTPRALARWSAQLHRAEGERGHRQVLREARDLLRNRIPAPAPRRRG